MKKLRTICILFFLLSLISIPTFAQSYNLRLLFHGVKNIPDSDFGIATWTVCPNMVSTPDKWFVVLGPRYSSHDVEQKSEWWLEAMGGIFMQKGKATPLIDIRHSLTTDEISRFLNVEWIDPGKENSIYVFYSIDYSPSLIKNIGAIGIETENTLKGKNETVSIGPHVVLPLNNSTLVIAYQFHLMTGRSDQIWARVVVNF